MPSAETKPKTLYDKVFDQHIVNEQDDGTCLLYIGMPNTSCGLHLKPSSNASTDRHLVHEVTSPQAFEGLKNASRPVRRPDCTLVTVDHVRCTAGFALMHIC